MVIKAGITQLGTGRCLSTGWVCWQGKPRSEGEGCWSILLKSVCTYLLFGQYPYHSPRLMVKSESCSLDFLIGRLFFLLFFGLLPAEDFGQEGGALSWLSSWEMRTMREASSQSVAQPSRTCIKVFWTHSMDGILFMMGVSLEFLDWCLVVQQSANLPLPHQQIIKHDSAFRYKAFSIRKIKRT